MKAKLTNSFVSGVTVSERPFEVCDTELPGFILRVQPSGSRSFLVSYRRKDSGKRDRLIIGRYPAITAPFARDEAKKIIGEVASGRDPKSIRKASRNSRPVPTLGEFLDGPYRDWALANLSAADAIVNRLKRVFSKFISLPLTQLNAWIFDKWKFDRSKEGKSTQTVNRELAAVRAALAKAVDWDLLPAHPLSKVKQLKAVDDNRIRFLSTREESQLRAALEVRENKLRAARTSFNKWRRQRGYSELPELSEFRFADHLSPMVLLAMNTGMRRGEIFSLKWRDVNIQGDLPKVKVSGQSAKNRRARHIPLNSEATSALKKWRAQKAPTDDEYVFPGQDGSGRLTDVKRAWQSLMNGAQLSDFRFHDLRHHFASRLVMSGVDINTVRELLGHADTKMTLRYAHLAPDHKAVAIERIVGSR